MQKVDMNEKERYFEERLTKSSIVKKILDKEVLQDEAVVEAEIDHKLSFFEGKREYLYQLVFEEFERFAPCDTKVYSINFSFEEERLLCKIILKKI